MVVTLWKAPSRYCSLDNGGYFMRRTVPLKICGIYGPWAWLRNLDLQGAQSLHIVQMRSPSSLGFASTKCATQLRPGYVSRSAMHTVSPTSGCVMQKLRHPKVHSGKGDLGEKCPSDWRQRGRSDVRRQLVELNMPPKMEAADEDPASSGPGPIVYMPSQNETEEIHLGDVGWQQQQQQQQQQHVGWLARCMSQR